MGSTPRPRIKHRQIIRLGRILDMMYRPADIADELQVSVETIYRSWLPAGLPHEQDEQQNIWIHGPALVAWVRAISSSRHKGGMADGFGWCMKCNQPVKMNSPKIIHQSRYTEILQSVCPHCKTPVNRARKRSQ
jgi:uncharacterized protein with PIN domain